MDKNKIIDKLLKKYPDLQEEPLFDELLSMDAEEEVNEEEPSMAIEIEAGSEDMGNEDEMADSEDAGEEEDKAISLAMSDEEEMPEEEAPAGPPADKLREILKMRKKMKKA